MLRRVHAEAGLGVFHSVMGQENLKVDHLDHAEPTIFK